jgi:hypothetical protein
LSAAWQCCITHAEQVPKKMKMMVPADLAVRTVTRQTTRALQF